MLQQTTVAAVRPYFERFLARFPTVADLAAAPLDDVLRLWEGLGYYSRARNLHRAAQELVTRFAGEWPSTVKELRSLPGIGRYTAGAIVSFAFDRPAPIVEANTLRLYSRLLGYEADPRSTAGQRVLWEFAERLVPARAPGDFNQALIDLGATVCTPVEPQCDACPLKSCCRAFAVNRQSQIPPPPTRPAVTELTEVAVVVRMKKQVLLRRCQPGERWAGLWDFPRFAWNGEDSGQLFNPLTPSPPKDDHEAEIARKDFDREWNIAEKPLDTHEYFVELQQRVKLQIAEAWRMRDKTIHWIKAEAYREALAPRVRELTGVATRFEDTLEQHFRHTVTRYRIFLSCVVARRVGGELAGSSDDLRWVPVNRLSEYALSTTGRKIARHLSDRAM
jgi:A/G-specific adenine glycosylase